MTTLTALRCTTCGHGKADHEALDPQCSAARCTCLKFRPAALAPVPGPSPVRSVPAPPTATPDATPPAGPTVDQLVKACARSDAKRTQALGPKLIELAEKITAALRAERFAAEAKAKQSEEFAAKKAAVDRLAKQLAAAKADLRKVKPAASASAAGGGEYSCEDCDQTFSTPQGRGAHGFRAHGRRKAEGA